MENYLLAMSNLVNSQNRLVEKNWKKIILPNSFSSYNDFNGTHINYHSF